MKVTISAGPKGLLAYVPKKDLEEPIVATEHATVWGGWARLANGWVLELPVYEVAPQMPVTVEARKRPEA